MVRALQILQITFSFLLIVLVLLQSKGGGLASGIGSSISFYRSRRGLEKTIFILTVLSAVIVVANSLVLVILS